MNSRITDHPVFGQTLFFSNGVVEIGVPLVYGIRIAHFSFAGEKNVFFEQPADMKEFTTPDGWRLRGGHRLWLAPESERDYHPDNEEVEYSVAGDTLTVTQRIDPRLNVIKSLEISLEGSSVNLLHRIKNVSEEPIECALWALSVMAPGGVETVPLPRRSGGMSPLYNVCAWDYTDLADRRLSFSDECIKITHEPLERKLKIGVGHPAGPISYENGGTVFIKHISVDRGGVYTDSGVSFETFVSKYMVEIEGLSPYGPVFPGQTKEYAEKLELIRGSESL